TSRWWAIARQRSVSIGVAASAAPKRMRSSGFVGLEGGVLAHEPFVAGAGALGHELRAAGHLGLVDVQRHRDGVGGGVADGVVLVRRDQAAGAAGAGVDAAGGAEAEAFAVALEQFELGDLQLAVPD